MPITVMHSFNFFGPTFTFGDVHIYHYNIIPCLIIVPNSARYWLTVLLL